MADSIPPATEIKRDQMGDSLPPFAITRLGTLRYRCPHAVRWLRVSPDATSIAVALAELCELDDNSVLIFEAATGALVRTLSRHEQPIHGLDFSRDGSLIASSGYDGAIRLWAVSSGKRIRTMRGAFETADGLMFASDGRLLFSVHFEDGSVRVWDVGSGVELRCLRPVEEFVPSSSLIAVSSDGRTLATDDRDDILLWQPSVPHNVACLRGHGYGVTAIEFFRDSATLASASGDGSVWLWDVRSLHEIRKLEIQNGRISAIALSPDEQTLAAGGDSSDVVLWDMLRGTAIRGFSGHTGGVSQIAFSPNGKRLITAGAGQTIRIWDIESGECSLPKLGHTHAVSALCFLPDGSGILTGSLDGTIRCWDSATGAEKFAISAHARGVGRLALSRSGDRLASIEFGNDINESVGLSVWDLNTLSPIGPPRQQPGKVRALAFSPDGRQVITGTYRATFRRWDVAGGERLERKHDNQIHLIETAASPHEDLLAINAFDGILRLRDLGTLEPVGEFEVYRPRWTGKMAFSPDGRLLAIAGADHLVLTVEITTGRRVLELRGHEQPPISVAWSPDGRIIASGGHDRTIRLWDADAGVELMALHGHERSVEHVVFSPDGSMLASASGETWALVWDVAAIKRSLGVVW
jgi:WD40 repeat protein